MSAIAALEQLPTDGLTVRALTLLDDVVPGQWTNVTRFDAVVADVAGPGAGPAALSAIRQRAQVLESSDMRYAQAVSVFQLVDKVDQVAAGAAAASSLASAAGKLFGGLDFVSKLTPKPETTQCLDAGLKLVAEVVVFGLLNGMPTKGADGLARFAGALEDYGRHDLIRMGAWVTFDGLLPLGPEFVSKILDTFKAAAASDVADHAAFQHLGRHLPGNNSADQKAFIIDAVDTTGAWVGRFVKDKGLSQAGVLDKVKGVVDVAGGGMDVVAAAVDAATAYTSHTGTQTVARTLARHSTAALQDELWRRWLVGQA